MGDWRAKVAEDGCAVNITSDQRKKRPESYQDPALFHRDGYPFWWFGGCGEESVNCVGAGASSSDLGIFVVVVGGGEGYV